MSEPTLPEAEAAVRLWQNRRMDLRDAIDHVESALRLIQFIDLPTAKMIGHAFLSTLQDARTHASEILDRRSAEAERLWREGQDGTEAAR